jgi:hypothetical protein
MASDATAKGPFRTSEPMWDADSGIEVPYFAAFLMQLVPNIMQLDTLYCV